MIAMALQATHTGNRNGGGEPVLPSGLTGVTADSRNVEPGYLFAALPGTGTDGRRFIGDALHRGATAILAPAGTPKPDPLAADRFLTDADPRRCYARLAALFHRAQPEVVAAVTGTNGKTSVATFTRQIWQRLGLRAASLGTLGLEAPAGNRPGTLTTPDPAELHRLLSDLHHDGVGHLAMEASSHGLDQRRLDGVNVTTAGFTNLSRDHLDYHGSVAAYLTAKTRLFDPVLVDGGTAVVNADVPEAAAIESAAANRSARIMRYGRNGADLHLLAADPDATGTRLRLSVFGRATQVHLPLAGEFQVANALCALGLVLADNSVDVDAAVDALEHLHGARGRLERVAVHPSGAPVYVDYAHTPDALRTVLSAVRPHTLGRLVVVFGCGGDRDPGKRPQMGKAAHDLADRVIVTDDNPRSEDPAIIRAAALAAAPGAEEIGDRRAAILAAVADLAAGDLLIIAGKGHETGQIVGDQRRPFDDAAEVRAAVAATGHGQVQSDRGGVP